MRATLQALLQPGVLFAGDFLPDPTPFPLAPDTLYRRHRIADNVLSVGPDCGLAVNRTALLPRVPSVNLVAPTLR